MSLGSIGPSRVTTMAKPSGYVTLATDLPSRAANAVALIFQQQGKPSVRAALKDLCELQIKLHETPYLRYLGEMMRCAIEGDPRGLLKYRQLMNPDELKDPIVQDLSYWAIRNEWLARQVKTNDEWISSEGLDMFKKSLRADSLEQENRELRRLLARYEEPRT